MSDLREIEIGDGIVAWDGRVLEAFGFGFGDASRRVHAGLIESIAVSDGALVGAMATITPRGTGPISLAIGDDPQQRAELEELFTEVRSAGGGRR